MSTLEAAPGFRRAGKPREPVMVRPAEPDDFMKTISVVMTYYDEVLKRPYEPSAIANFVMKAAASDNQCCFVIGRPVYGLVSGIVALHPRTGELQAHKTAWFVKHRTRGAYFVLLRAFERWAKEKGATRLIVASQTVRGNDFLERVGYAPLETVFEKEIRS